MSDFLIGDIVKVKINKTETALGVISGISFDEDEVIYKISFGDEKEIISVSIDEIVEKLDPEMQKKINFLKNIFRQGII